MGVGGWGLTWTEIAHASKYWDVIAYVDVVKENLLTAANLTGMSETNCFTDLDDALKKVDADAILGVIPPEFHADVAIKAIEAGLHVLIEKPIADTLENAKKMINVARKHDLKFMVSQQYRYKRGPRTVKKIVEDKIAGDPSYVVINFHKAPIFPEGNFRRLMPYPLLHDMSIHHFDTSRSVLGVEPISVYAETWNTQWSTFKGDPVALVSLKMEKNVKVVYIGSWVSQMPEGTWDGSWRIECSEGEISWSNNKIFVKPHLFRTVYTKNMLEKNGILEAELIPMELQDRDYSLYEFAESIKQDRKPETSGEDNIKTFATILSAIESAKEKKEVSVKDKL